MATTNPNPTTAPPDTPPTGPDPRGDQRVVMAGVGWAGYLHVLRARGDGRRPKLVYLDGDLYLMSPAYHHERIAGRLGQLVWEIVLGLRLPFASAGSTTFRRRLKHGGLEADASFYLANAARVEGRDDLHLRRDPPPDLVIEAVHTHGADESVEVWRRFGVPEVWVCDGETLQILALQPDGRYAESDTSPAFPFLKSAEILDRVTRPGSDLDWGLDLRRWVTDVLLPRSRGPFDEPGGA